MTDTPDLHTLAAAAVLAAYAGNYPESVFPADSDSRDAIAGTAMRHAYTNAARIVRELASAAPETAPRPRQDDETAPAVPEATPGPAEGAVVIEHAQLMSGGGMHVRPNDPEIERIFPLEQWITAGQRGGGRVFRRTVIVVDGWTEVTAPQGAGATPADGQDGDDHG